MDLRIPRGQIPTCNFYLFRVPLFSALQRSSLYILICNVLLSRCQLQGPSRRSHHICVSLHVDCTFLLRDLQKQVRFVLSIRPVVFRMRTILLQHLLLNRPALVVSLDIVQWRRSLLFTNMLEFGQEYLQLCGSRTLVVDAF